MALHVLDSWILYQLSVDTWQSFGIIITLVNNRTISYLQGGSTKTSKPSQTLSVGYGSVNPDECDSLFVDQHLVFDVKERWIRPKISETEQ